MKHYKLLNLKRPQQGAFVVTSEGWKQIQNTKSLLVDIKNLGECTASGELIHDIAENNFTKPIENGVTKSAIAEPEQPAEQKTRKPRAAKVNSIDPDAKGFSTKDEDD